MADSRANSVCELPTERQVMVGTPASTFARLQLEGGKRVGVVGGAGGGEEVDALGEHGVADEREWAEVGSARSGGGRR